MIDICFSLIYQSFEPAPIIILEDISLLGYEMIGKPPGFEGVLKIANMLAKFHATSMFLQANVRSCGNTSPICTFNLFVMHREWT